MSTTVISKGYIAVLRKPITDEDVREEISESLWEGKSGLELNYGGTLVIFDEYSLKSYSEREFCSDLLIVGSLAQDSAKDFITLASQNKLDIIQSTVKPYVCVWYNGSDSPVSMMTVEDFLGEKND